MSVPVTNDYCLKHNISHPPDEECPGCYNDRHMLADQGPAAKQADQFQQFADKMVASPTGGVKADLGKPRYDLLSEIALEKIAQVLAHGAEKYDEDNWRKGIEYRRLIRSAIGHILKFSKGENIDPESNLEHLAEAACNIIFLLEMVEIHPELDNRFKQSVKQL